MDRFNTAPGGDVFFAGTYNAHPLCTSAALATLEELEKGSVYEHIFSLGDKVRRGIQEICDQIGLTAFATGFGSVFVTYFLKPPVENYTDLLRNDKITFVSFRKKMIERGVFMLPMNLKRNHISAAHTTEDIEKTLNVAKQALGEIAGAKKTASLL